MLVQVSNLPSVCGRLRSRSDWRSHWMRPVGRSPEHSRNHHHHHHHHTTAALQTHGAVEVDAGYSCVAPHQGAFGLTVTCRRHPEVKTGGGQRANGTASPEFWFVCSPATTSHSFTLRSIPPVARRREPGLNFTAFTSPSWASCKHRQRQQPEARTPTGNIPDTHKDVQSCGGKPDLRAEPSRTVRVLR